MASRNQPSAMDQYFSEFVPMLEEAIRDDFVEDDDPTIDLNCLQVARKEPERRKHQVPPPMSRQHVPEPQAKAPRKSMTNRTFEMAVKEGSCSLDGLRDMTEHLKRGSLYGDKLIRIMLDGLEKSISREFFSFIVEHGVPATWLPIVKRNNEDTPYIEFLIKNDKSDEEPFSQIIDYSLDHLALSKFILDEMLKSARGSEQQNLPPDVWHPPQPTSRAAIKSSSQYVSQPKQQPPQQKQQQQTPQQLQQQRQNQLKQQQLHEQLKQQEAKKKVLASDKYKRSSLPPMTTSTPIRQRQPIVSKRASTIPDPRQTNESLNDSKRILPPRACKNPIDGIYSKYLG